MKRIITVALAAALIAGGHANASQEWRTKQCRYQSLERRVWSPREERLTTTCVLERWSVPGGRSTFDRIIACESGWNRLAYNHSGPYVGLGQHVLSAWDSRVRSYTPRRWELSPRWQNSRTMLTITARMMHRVGLEPWSCA